MMLSKISFMITSILAKVEISEEIHQINSLKKQKKILARFQEINHVPVDQARSLNTAVESYNQIFKMIKYSLNVVKMFVIKRSL